MASSNGPTLTSMNGPPPPPATSCATCNGASSDDGDHWTLMTTTFSWTSASWVLSATQPACTWEGHCLGDVCKVNDGCDWDWECQNGICQPCCSPAAGSKPPGQGLNTGAAVGIGVAVPAIIAVIAGIAYLLWRVRRKKRKDMYERQRDNTGDFGKSELEGRGVPMDDIAKKVDPDKAAELGTDASHRAELADHNNEVAAEADTIIPVELEDTSATGRKKLEAIRTPEAPRTPRWVEVQSPGQAEEAIEMYRPSVTSGFLASPTKTAATTTSPAPTGVTSASSEWPLPRQMPGSPGSTTQSSYQVSPQTGTIPTHMLRSPVSALSPQQRTFWQRSPRRANGPGLPEGMIDRFDVDDDDEESQASPRRRTTRPHGQARDHNDDSDDESMFGWPMPPGENAKHPR